MSQIPESIGPYRVIETLGRGGMGIVYCCEHRETGELAAVKTVLVPQEKLLQSIRREIQALAGLKHPGIVRILEQGLEAGLPWYAMALVQGQSLRQWLSQEEQEASTEIDAERGGSDRWWTQSHVFTAPPESPDAQEAPLSMDKSKGRDSSLSRILSVVRKLCWTLSYLHGEGQVHRDLKPANVLVTTSGWPVLVDFGLAQQFSGEVSRDVLEISAAMSGTLAYMAPEQIRGELVDARADLYALGCILYELLTGQPPFVDPSPRKVLLQHLSVEPIPPSQHRSEIRPELDRLVMRLLAKKPNQRPGYASDIALALEELGAVGERPSELPDGRTYLYRSGLVGREDVLERLESRFDRL